MLMKMPSERYLRVLAKQSFSSERALQRFIEANIGPLFALQVVSSSQAGGQGLGGIDAIAIDGEGAPIVLEYKRDLIDQKAMNQLARYKDWLLAHKERF